MCPLTDQSVFRIDRIASEDPTLVGSSHLAGSVTGNSEIAISFALPLHLYFGIRLLLLSLTTAATYRVTVTYSRRLKVHYYPAAAIRTPKSTANPLPALTKSGRPKSRRKKEDGGARCVWSSLNGWDIQVSCAPPAHDRVETDCATVEKNNRCPIYTLSVHPDGTRLATGSIGRSPSWPQEQAKLRRNSQMVQINTRIAYG